MKDTRVIPVSQQTKKSAGFRYGACCFFGGSIAEDCRHFQNRSDLSLLTFVLLQSDVEHLAHQQGEAALAKDLNTITCHFASLGGIEV